MQSRRDDNQNEAFDASNAIRNPFGVMDVPDPDDEADVAFASAAAFEASEDDANALPWAASGGERCDTIEGAWSSRWNGGADPTIPGDAADKWKEGSGKTKAVAERVYLLFDWDRGARRGLIEARRAGGERLIGKYLNLNNPQIIRPWVGLIVNNRRIDGRWSGGRLDFRR